MGYCHNCGAHILPIVVDKYNSICYNCMTNDGRCDHYYLGTVHPEKLNMANPCEKHPDSTRDILIRCVECEKEKNAK